MCLWRAIPVLLLTETYSISDTIRCSELIFYFPCPALKLVISLKSPGFFYWRIFSNHNLGTGCHGHYWGFVASSIYQWTELRNICMYNNPCVHTRAHILSCVQPSKHGFSLFLINPVPQFHFSLPFLCICNFPLQH